MSDQSRLSKAVASLERVNLETKKVIFGMAQGLRDIDVIQSFNQFSLDLFTMIIEITHKLGEKEGEVRAYKVLYDNAIKINIKLPIEKFTLFILEYAPEIYAEDEDCFLKMPIPDKKITVDNEFGLIRSEMFKKLWVKLDKTDKNRIKDKVVLVTMYAHAYLYQNVLHKHLGK